MSDSPSRKYTPQTDVQFVKGVGPRTAKLLAKLKIGTLGDLLYYLPRRYEDRSNFQPIGEVKPGEWVSLKGRVISLDSRDRGGRFMIIKAAIADGSGAIGLVWFNQRWIKRKLTGFDGEIIVYGQVKEGQWGLQIESPEWETVDPDDDPEEFARITPVYPLTEGVGQMTIRRVAKRGLEYLSAFSEPLPDSFLRKHRLRPLGWSLRQIHSPDSDEAREQARRRLVFEEFFYLQVALLMRQRELGLQRGIAFDIPPASGGGRVSPAEELRAVLPWEFTDAQDRVMEEIFSDMRRPHPMSRLLQGDVGSGKTIVAAAAMLAAVRCGYQAALMAPTEILAEQHYTNFRRLFQPLGVEVDLLVGKQTKKQKERALQRTADGKAQIAVGTHALIQEGVQFAKLGLVVVDEQHRFGVMQRAALRQKGYGNPDVLVMTATPIPRSLTLTVYGDLDLSVIDEMPPGRRPVKTHWKLPSERQSVYDGVRSLLKDGAQAYIVCPLVSESEKMMAQAAKELYDRTREDVFPEFRVGLLHGQLKSKAKEEAMDAFRAGELDALVTTTVIEVGVDVANATVMVIEDANRFGLAQLHQLRGRVGRGRKQSYCVLIGGASTPEAERRLRVMAETTDGFKIAEEDLRIRGPGELYGTKQSGAFELRVADLIQDGRLLEEARQAAIALLKKDPELSQPAHQLIREAAEQNRTRLARTDVS